MSFELEFLTMMPHTVSLQRRTGRTSAGVITYDATVHTYRARVTGKILSLRRRDSSENSVIFDIYANVGSDVVKLDDKLTIVDGGPEWYDITPEIFAIARATDDDGHHHVKIQCGWQYHRQGQ